MEMIIGLAIGTIGVLIFSSGVLATLSSADFVKELATRDELNFTIRRTILDRQSLNYTIGQNPVMRAVLRNQYAAPFNKVYSNVEYGITLYDASGMAIAGPDADFMNPKPAPRYYDSEGYPCTTPGEGRCVLAVMTTFQMQGIPEWKSGTKINIIPHQEYPLWDGSVKPEFIQLNYKIEYVGKTGKSHEIHRKPIQGAIFLGVEDLGK